MSKHELSFSHQISLVIRIYGVAECVMLKIIYLAYLLSRDDFLKAYSLEPIATNSHPLYDII